MSTNFRLVDRDTAYLLPPSVDEWLTDNHLARFVVEIVDELDVSSLKPTCQERVFPSNEALF